MYGILDYKNSKNMEMFMKKSDKKSSSNQKYTSVFKNNSESNLKTSRVKNQGSKDKVKNFGVRNLDDNNYDSSTYSNGNGSERNNKPTNLNPYMALSVFNKIGQNIMNSNSNSNNNSYKLNKVGLSSESIKNFSKYENINNGGNTTKKKDKITLDIIQTNKNNINIKKETSQELSFEVSNNYSSIKNNLTLWEILLDFELTIDIKSNLMLNCKRLHAILLSLKEDNVNTYETFVTSKTYLKFLNLVVIFFIYLKFLLNDFNFESNIKVNFKRICHSLNEYILQMFEFIVLVNSEFSETSKGIYSAFLERQEQMTKLHKINKGLKLKDSNQILSKNIENISNSIKQFSK